MKKFLTYSLMAAGLAMFSCDKDLDIENPNQLAVEAYWKTPNDALLGVNATYSTLHRGMSRFLPWYYIGRSDEGRSLSPASHLVNNFDQFLVTDYNLGDTYGPLWRDSYIGVNRANQVINNVPNIEMDETLKQRYIGEAKFLRGMFYFHLATIYGNVPLITKVSVVGDLPPTATQAEVFAQIERDLTDAAAVLPATYGSADLGRATKGAAYALLAKVYMQQHKYAEAVAPLKWLVEDEGRNIYDLMPNYRDNFLVTSENNKESVFEWQFALNPAENHDDDTDPRADNLNYGQSLAKFMSPPGVGWSDVEARRWVVDEFNERTTTGARDPRLAASFLFDYTDERGPAFTMVYGQTFAQRYGANNDRVWFRKFLNDNWKNTEEYNSPNNWRYIRYADVLLMYAEVLNETGNTAKAYQYVDRVRQRAGLARLSDVKPNLTKEQFLEQIKHERLLELSGEGQRWHDLVRWGDLTSPTTKQRDPAFNSFTPGQDEFLPIPQLELDLNPNLNQNPGY
ncbi:MULTISPECIES: RagB/SusD family nutrient uptake outer membrane protein [Rufibacter]|uniref:RagB/SusD family nutrient uptake outer membrane protein n=1 Tax=Rufibacter TaxID=1379908 RepID=UPI001B3044EE|nr:MULTISPECIES: RagB/SusD family nutrient uptake outer membrane protein [Rufibacter]